MLRQIIIIVVALLLAYGLVFYAGGPLSELMHHEGRGAGVELVRSERRQIEEIRSDENIPQADKTGP